MSAPDADPREELARLTAGLRSQVRRARLAGEGRPPGWEDAPWVWIIVSSAVLLTLALGAYRLSTGVAPGSKIEPPRYIDGKIEPSRVVE